MIPAQVIHMSLSKRYPNASIFVLDDAYECPTRKMVQVAYDKFQGSLWKYNVFKWLRNKWDCDKFAWAFKASCAIGNALSKNVNAQPVGFICYHQGADVTKGHAINMAFIANGSGSQIVEIEPQPKSGIKELTLEERNTVWLVVI